MILLNVGFDPSIDALQAKKIARTLTKSPARKEKTLIVLDAGIATEENLTKIKAKGYNYLCVSRTRLKEYTLREDNKCVIVQDSSKREIKLREVHTAPDEDYFLEITSPPRKR